MTKAFSHWGKKRYNRVFKAYRFEYLDYQNLARDDKTRVKRNHEVSMIEKEVAHGLKK